MKNNDFTSGAILPKLLKFMLPVFLFPFAMPHAPFSPETEDAETDDGASSDTGFSERMEPEAESPVLSEADVPDIGSAPQDDGLTDGVTSENAGNSGTDAEIRMTSPDADFDVVTYNLLECPIAVGFSEELASSDDNYRLFDGNGNYTIELQPAMKLLAKVAFIKEIPAGTSIGYGREYIAPKRAKIATVPLGYADGYIRAYKGFHVEINGKFAPVAGRVCMDQFMVDVTEIPNVKIGDEVILFGSDKISIDDAAKHLKTINYEITCLVSNRVPKVFLK